MLKIIFKIAIHFLNPSNLEQKLSILSHKVKLVWQNNFLVQMLTTDCTYWLKLL